MLVETPGTAREQTLAVTGLTIEYSSGGYAVRPIEGLDLSIRSGELVLLLGASGCGKTTLLSALAAILTPSSGSIVFGDATVTELRGGALTHYRRHTVGVVFQAFNLVPSLSALENVMLPMRAARYRPRRAREHAATLLRDVGLGDRLGHKPGGLSGGQQQRVAIARALAFNPPLILADEPTAHLDYIQVESVIRLLRELARPGRVVVVATHDERMVPLADRVVELSPRASGNSGPPELLLLAAGGVIFEQGDTADRVYVVDDGEIELVRALAVGGDELLARVHAGDYFGELGPLFGLRRAATARATTPAAVTSYSIRDFRNRIQPGSVSDLIAKAAD